MKSTSLGHDGHATSLDEQVAAAKVRFEETFGTPSRWIAAAPGRVNLIGEHTDYNDGFVFPLAIERYVVIAAAEGEEGSGFRVQGSAVETDNSRDATHRRRPAHNANIRVHSTLLGQTAEFSLDRLEPQRRDWTSYVRGVFAGCIERGMAPGPLDLLVDSQVPLGGGLSSSAALEVATATLLEAVTGQTLDPVDKARLCQRAEHEYAGMPCGIMDQFSSALGAAGQMLLIDCRSETAALMPLDDQSVAVLVINSNVKHELTGSEYADRRAQCEAAAKILGVAALRDVTSQRLAAEQAKLSPILFRRARHVVGEIERTLDAAVALRRGDWRRVGSLMYDSHASLRDDYEVSCPELDALVEAAQGIGDAGGVIGSRMTGGGFGGCTVSLVRTGREAEIAAHIGAAYRERTGISATAFVTKPARGAHVVT